MIYNLDQTILSIIRSVSSSEEVLGLTGLRVYLRQLRTIKLGLPRRSGKTTAIAKLAYWFADQGKRVVFISPTFMRTNETIHPGLWYFDRMSSLSRRAFLGLGDFDYIFIDEYSIVQSSYLEEIYDHCHKDSVIVIVGTE